MCSLEEKGDSGEEKKKAQAHLILGKDLTDCNVYYKEMDFNKRSRPWDWLQPPKFNIFSLYLIINKIIAIIIIIFKVIFLASFLALHFYI